MHMYDLILKKRRGGELSAPELAYIVRGCTDGSIPDYQLSAFLMAVCFCDMTPRETTELTLAMARSGDMADLSAIPGIKGDKHSTGGVGDKTTLAVAPIAAACGLVMAKMSGRGLGHTGGTVDKLESIPGYRTDLSAAEFIDIVSRVGICVTGQSGNLAPADKKLYALRDVTATVDSLPLIASSIMSKKLAAGADVILLDVKYGSGAFLSQPQEACALAGRMVDIGNRAGRKTAALITDMDIPLGTAIGNSLELREAIDVLRGNAPSDLTAVCIALSAALLSLAGMGDKAQCRTLAEDAVKSGAALAKLRDMVETAGGDVGYIDDPARFPRAVHILPVYAPAKGFIRHMDTAAIGRICVTLGAGREQAGDEIDHAAGILLRRKTGDYVKVGETLAYLHTNRPQALDSAAAAYTAALDIGQAAPEARPLIYGEVTEDGVGLYR